MINTPKIRNSLIRKSLTIPPYLIAGLGGLVSEADGMLPEDAEPNAHPEVVTIFSKKVTKRKSQQAVGRSLITSQALRQGMHKGPRRRRILSALAWSKGLE